MAILELDGEIEIDDLINGFAFILTDASVESGEDFCIDLTVNDFEEILGMQFTLNWNTNDLQFNSITTQNLGISIVETTM